MTRQLLFEMLNKRLFFDLILLILSCGLSWTIILKLGYKILKIEIKIINIIPRALLLSLFAVFLKPLVPGIFAFLIPIILPVLFFKFHGKTKWIIAGWVAFLLMLFMNVGILLIIVPLIKANETMASFFLENMYGMMVGSLLGEAGFPAVMLLFFKFFNVSLIPSPRNLVSTVDFCDFYLFFALCYWGYCSLMTIWGKIGVAPMQQDFILFLIKPAIEWSIAAGALVAFYIKKTNAQKRTEAEIEKAKIPPPDLDPREKLIVRCIIEGMTNKEIAAEVQMSRGGIGNAITPIYKKLGVESRVQLITYFVKNNLMEWLAND